MPRTSREITVNASPAKIFDHIVEFSRHPEWASDVLQIEATSEGPVRVGSTFRSQAKMMGKHTAELRVTELVANQRLVFEATDNTGRWRHEFTVLADGGSTRLTRSIERMEPGTGLWRILPTLLFPLLGPADVKKTLGRIKANVEGPAANSASQDSVARIEPRPASSATSAAMSGAGEGAREWKLLSCRDVGTDCDFEARATNIEEVVEQCAAHASSAHGLKSFSPQLYTEMRKHVRTVLA